MVDRSLSYVGALVPDERVALVIGDGAGAEAAACAAEDAGSRIAARVSVAEAPARLALQARLHLVAIDLDGGDATEAKLAALDAVADAARRLDARVIASVPAECIDLAYAALDGIDGDLLCAPSVVERTVAFARAAATPPMLHDAAREAEQRRLRHLNDEVARIADTLARLARAETAPLIAQVAERGMTYRSMVDEGDAGIEPGQIRAAIRARRLRDQFFEGGLFADPAWDMLLDLFAAHLEHARVSVSSLCIAAAVPPTTALRWITTMREAGLLERQGDPFDRRRAFVVLTETALAAMRRYCGALRRAGLSMP